VPYWNDTCRQFSPSGRLLVSKISEDEIGLWDVPSGKKLRAIKADKEIFRCVFSQQEQLIFTISEKKLTLWDIDDGTEIYSIQENVDNGIFSPDDKIFFTHSDTILKARHVNDGQILGMYPADRSITTIAVDRTGKYVVIGDMVGKVYLLLLMDFFSPVIK
jgi:hypothetical protein